MPGLRNVPKPPLAAKAIIVVGSSLTKPCIEKLEGTYKKDSLGS